MDPKLEAWLKFTDRQKDKGTDWKTDHKQYQGLSAKYCNNI